MKLRHRIHRRATYNRYDARFRAFYKAMTQAMVQVAEHMSHVLSFVGPPKPTRLQWMGTHLTFPFNENDAKRLMSRRDVVTVAQSLPPIVGLINVQ